MEKNYLEFIRTLQQSKCTVSEFCSLLNISLQAYYQTLKRGDMRTRTAEKWLKVLGYQIEYKLSLNDNGSTIQLSDVGFKDMLMSMTKSEGSMKLGCFSEFLIAMRLREMNFKMLSEKTGICKNTISRTFNQNDAYFDTLYRIAEVLDCTLMLKISAAQTDQKAPIIISM